MRTKREILSDNKILGTLNQHDATNRVEESMEEYAKLFAKNAIQEVIKKYWMENSKTIMLGGKMRTIDYIALDYIKENYPIKEQKSNKIL